MFYFWDLILKLKSVSFAVLNSNYFVVFLKEKFVKLKSNNDEAAAEWPEKQTVTTKTVKCQAMPEYLVYKQVQEHSPVHSNCSNQTHRQPFPVQPIMQLK